MSGKKKAQKMSLSDFLADDSTSTTGGSWADDVVELPTAPASRESRNESRGYHDEDRGFFERSERRNSDKGFGGPRGFGGRRGSVERHERRGFEQRERQFTPRAPVELPTKPPYTAHIASLSFDATEDDLAGLFADLKIVSIRLLRDRQTERPKGFGYVEFEDLDSLKKALEFSGESIHGRSIRISVAEPPRETDRVRQPDRTDVDSWRRKEPLEFSEAPRREYGSRGGFGGRGGFNRGDRFGGDRQAERPRLNLKPRSTDNTDSAANAPAKTPKSDPFGGARPVDTDKVLKDIEKKLEATHVSPKNPEEQP
ncbi:RNA-binding domain-containing protein [Rhizopus microsporus var. microsporus]|uniref:RNA-binding domain-containing protein n=1 Tax=Rhizopus microsporus var. microsporus TaxID=86635 RepID=A0A1X0QYX0_RHIZD|nr:RNA-binding domain-containing protein [Rhizopus microsporus var. microsporus]